MLLVCALVVNALLLVWIYERLRQIASDTFASAISMDALSDHTRHNLITLTSWQIRELGGDELTATEDQKREQRLADLREVRDAALAWEGTRAVRERYTAK